MVIENFQQLNVSEGSHFLNAQMHSLLLELDQAKQQLGTEWVASSALRHYPTHLRQEAQRRGYTQGRGNTSQREYRLLPKGRTALANNAEANLDMMPEIERGFVPTAEINVMPNGSSAVKHAPAVRQVTVSPAVKDRLIAKEGLTEADFITAPEAPEEKNIDLTALDKALIAALKRDHIHAQACVRAIDILVEDFPEVADLVESLVKLEQRKAAANE